jgi:moderate conductance mechanosensitive channel
VSPAPANATLLAQADEAPNLDLGVVGLLRDRVENEFLLVVIDSMLSPALNILLVLLLAVVASLLAKRALGRVVERAKDPSEQRRGGLKRKIGLSEGDPLDSLRRAQRAEAVGALVGSIVSVVIWTLALFMILGQVGINLGPLIAGAGIVGVALGFGAQDLVKDFLSGVFMLIEDQYGVGDVIDAGEAIGVVEGISLRTTRIRDITGTLWHVPNGEIARVGNMSQEWARALLDVGVSYGTDVEVASEIILRVATDMAHEEEFEESFLGEPEVWGIQELGPDSVDIRLVIKTTPGAQWGIARELRRRIKAAFDVAKIEIPYPQRTVWLRTEAPAAVGDEDTPGWEDEMPDKRTRTRAVKHAAKLSESTTANLDEFIPEAEEAAEHGGGDDGEPQQPS